MKKDSRGSQAIQWSERTNLSKDSSQNNFFPKARVYLLDFLLNGSECTQKPKGCRALLLQEVCHTLGVLANCCCLIDTAESVDDKKIMACASKQKAASYPSFGIEFPFRSLSLVIQCNHPIPTPSMHSKFLQGLSETSASAQIREICSHTAMPGKIPLDMIWLWI